MLAGCAVRLLVARPGDTNYCSDADTTHEKFKACVAGIAYGLILHPQTFYFLVSGDKGALKAKSVKIMFLSFPQFQLQTYSIFLFGFENHEIMKILAVFTPCQTSSSNFSSYLSAGSCSVDMLSL